MSNFESLLSKNFEQEEIIKLKERQDYLEVKAEIEQMQANKMLDNLEWRINQEVLDKSYNLDERFQKFIDSIQANSKKSETITESFNQEEYISEQKTQLREKFLEKISWDETSDITDKKTLLWFGGLWALEQIENEEKVDKDSDFFDKIVTWIKAKVGFFVLNFLWYWDDYKKYKHDSNNIKLPELDITWINNNPELNKNNKYFVWINILANMYDNRKGVEKGDYVSVLYDKDFLKLSINDLESIKHDQYSSEKFNKFADIHGSSKVKTAVRLLTSWNSAQLIENIYSKSNKNINFKEISISELFEHISQDFDLISWMKNKVTLWKIMNWEIPSKNQIDKKTVEYVENKSLSVDLLIAARSNLYNFTEDKELLISQLMTLPNWEKDKEKINNLVDYGYKIQKNLFLKEKWPFNIYKASGWNQTIEKIFIDSPLSLNEVIKLRMITWDKTSFENLNDLQIASLYMLIERFLSNRNCMEESGSFAIWLVKIWTWSTEQVYSNVPDWVKNVLRWLTNKTIDTTTTWLEIILRKIKWWFNESPTAWLTALALYMPIFTDRYSAKDAIFQ